MNFAGRLFLLSAALTLRAQEFALLAGTMRAPELDQSSYSWQIDYRQDFFRNLGASISQINEGHVVGHHRDGSAVQIWGRLPMAENRFTLSLGLGAYYFYDTQELPSGITENVHGAAPILSLSAAGHISERWFYQLTLNRIAPTHEMKTNTAVLGIGYWFGQDEKPTPGDFGHPANDKTRVSQNEWTLFGGESVVNTYSSESAGAFALEYRHGFIHHVDWSVDYIYEGNPVIVRRSGIATQVWAVNHFFHRRYSVGIGFGPYFYLDRKHPSEAGGINPAAIAPLASLSIAQRLSDHWNLRFVFDRVASSYSRDADIYLLGLGYH